MQSKHITMVLLTVVVGAGLTAGVLYYQPILNMAGISNQTTNQPAPQAFFSNKTYISLANQTQSPPITHPSLTLMGGNQYVSLHFAMNVTNNGSYQYSDIHFIGSAWNFTGSSLSNPNNIPIANTTQSNFNTSFTIQPTIHNEYFQGSNNSGAQIYPSESSSLTTGDISGQGKDYLIASYYVKTQTAMDSELVILNWDNISQTFKPWTSNISLGLYYPTVLAINFRGYDTQQLIVAGYTSMSASYVTLKMINFSPTGAPVQNASSLSITTRTLNNIQTTPGPLVLEKGDLYGYGAQQFLVYGTTREGAKYLSLYNYNLTNNAITFLSTLQDPNLGRPLLTSFFSNGIDQLIVPCMTACVSGVDNPNVASIESGFIYVFDPFNNTLLKYASFPYYGFVGAGTIDGNGVNELILLQTNNIYLFKFSRTYMLVNPTNNLYNALPFDTKTSDNSNRIYGLNTGTYDATSDIPILTTDLTFDFIPEIILPDFTTGGARFYLMRSQNLVYGNSPSINNNNVIDNQYVPSSSITSVANNTYYYSLSNARTTGDLFGQALRLIHRDTYLTPTKPTIMAVLAAPPIVSAVSQDPTNAATEFGKSTTQSTSSELSTTLGFDMEVGIGTHEEVSYGVGVEMLGLEVNFLGKFGFGMSFSHSYETTRELTLSQTWGTDGQHNGVVFASLLVKHWNYTVVNGPLNGDNLTFSYPLAVTIQKFDMDTFNQLFPGYNIQTGTFGTIQKLGHPETYPTKSQIPSITAGSPFLYESDQKGVSQGTGWDTVTIDSSTEKSTTYGYDFHTSEGFSFDMATEGFAMSLDFQATQQFGYGMTVTQGQGTTYSGTVTDINSYTDWSHYQYNYGLFAYMKNRTDLPISYQVINYWVEPLGPSFGSTALIINVPNPMAVFLNLLAMIPVKFL